MFENIRISFQGIWAHKMRSLLTMLGIIIGIGALIAIVSTIKGTSEQIKNSIISKDNVLRIKLMDGSWEYYSSEGSMAEGVGEISKEIIEEIKQIKEIENIATYKSGQIGLSYKGVLTEGAIAYGIDETYFDVDSYKLVRGRLFTPKDISTNKKFVILTKKSQKDFGLGKNPIGQIIEIKGEPFVVIGIVEKEEKKKKIDSLSELDIYNMEALGNEIFLPKNLWPVFFKFEEPSNVIIKSNSIENMSKAGKKATKILNDYISPETNPMNQGEQSEENEMEAVENRFKYKSIDALEKAKTLQEVSNATNKQLLLIASISLLVGGIGVMNIMLVSVTERTREIGLKKALGARKFVILSQFITEAAVLTSIGGFLGIIFGIGLAYLVSYIATVPVAISLSAALVSFFFSMGIGVIFGIMPSIKAANLNPIEALRYE